MSRFTVWYEGSLFVGDTEGYNEHDFTWEKAIELYNVYGDMIHIRDNKYGITFDYGEWN